MASTEGRSVQSNLHQQDLSKLDVTKLSALSPEVISRQATINIGTIGHVAHGKSTVVKAISGVQTVRFKNELERNITIKLERLPDSVVRTYREMADERNERLFYEKIQRSKKRNLSLEPDEEQDMPPSKKLKKSKSVKKSEEFIIENILDFKYMSGKEYYFVKWQGWPNSENTWEPIEHLDNCPTILQRFLINEELKHCDKIEKLKEEISFGNLLNEELLIDRLSEIDQSDISKLKSSLMIKLLSMIHLSEHDEDYVVDLVQESRSLLQLYVLTRKRCRQLMKLKDWEEHLNQVDKSKKITVINEVDLAGPPAHFTYINQSIPGAGVTIPDEPPIGCECAACNCRSKSCCGMQAGLFAYTINKRIRVAPGTPIYECNKACKCSTECSNRVVQGGRNVKLSIFRTSNGCGWGVRTDQKIRQGQFLCQYVGEVITFEEAEKRGREYDARGLTYLFDLDFNSVENPYVVDAAHMGNVSHFINHSCDPNLGVWAVWADCLDPNLPMLALFATREIEAGEEICFDYLQKSFENDEQTIDTTSTEENIVDDNNISIPNVSEQSANDSEPGVNGSEDGVNGSEGGVSGLEGGANGSEGGAAASPLSPIKSRFEIQQQNMAMLRNRTECKCGAVKCRKYLF